MLKKLTTKNEAQEKLDLSELKTATGGTATCAPRICRKFCGFNNELLVLVTVDLYEA